MAPPHPEIIIGGARFGDPNHSTLTSGEAMRKLFEVAKSIGVSRIDTAALYPTDNAGESERMLGLGDVATTGFRVDSKIKLKSATDTNGSLSEENVRESVPESLERLGVKQLHTLYNHAADSATPLEEQVRAMDEQLRLGRCKELGLCNLSAEQVKAWLAVCEEKGYAKPKVYQGMYNAIRRSRETELIPLLRQHGIKFAASSPLAAGVLNGNLKTGAGTRAKATDTLGFFFRKFFDLPATAQAVDRIIEAGEPHGIKSLELAVRWICYHSKLGPEDAIILGSSRVEQLVEAVEMVERGELPPDAVKAVDEAYEIVVAAGEI